MEQNTPQSNQPTPTKKTNPWQISTIVLLVFVAALISYSVYLTINKPQTQSSSQSQSTSQTKNEVSNSEQSTTQITNQNDTLVKIATIDTKELGAAINKHNADKHNADGSNGKFVFDFDYIKVNKAKTHQILRASAGANAPDAVGSFAVIAYRSLSDSEWKIAITGHQFVDFKDQPISKHVSAEALEVFKDDRFWYTEAEVNANAQKTPDLQ